MNHHELAGVDGGMCSFRIELAQLHPRISGEVVVWL
jgi:hypothetical protein